MRKDLRGTSLIRVYRFEKETHPMFGSLGTFLMTVITSLSTVLAPIVFGAGALGAGVTWAIGNHNAAKSLLVGALIGTAIIIFSPSLGQGFVAAAGSH